MNFVHDKVKRNHLTNKLFNKHFLSGHSFGVQKHPLSTAETPRTLWNHIAQVFNNYPMNQLKEQTFNRHKKFIYYIKYTEKPFH